MKFLSPIFLLASFSTCPCSSYHILFFHNLGTKSHLITMRPLMSELLQRGHTVTAIIFDSIKVVHENYTEIVLPTDLDSAIRKGSERMMRGGGTSMMNPMNWMWTYYMYKELIGDLAMDMIKPEPIQDFLRQRPSVDVVVGVQHQAGLFAEIFDCPIVQFAPGGLVPFMTDGLATDINLSVQPVLTAPFIEPMTFLNRISNHALNAVSRLRGRLFVHFLFSHQREFLSTELGLQVQDSFTSFRERNSVLLACSHPITHGAWQYGPNIVEVSVLHSFPCYSPRLGGFSSRTRSPCLTIFSSFLIRPQMELSLYLLAR